MRERSGTFVGVLVVLVLALTACSSSSDNVSFSGTWSGTIADSFCGAGLASLSVNQTGRDLLGSWQATFGACTGNGGILVGDVSGTSVSVILEPSNPNFCSYLFTGQRNGSSLSGNYAAINCTEIVTGTINLTRQ